MSVPSSSITNNNSTNSVPLLTWVGTTSLATVILLVLSTNLRKAMERVTSAWVGRFYLNWILMGRKKKISVNATSSESTTPDDIQKYDAVITGLFIHPVKSLKAVPVQSVTTDSRGLVNDRRYMLVTPAPVPLWGSFGPNDATHRFLTQRQCPILTQISATINVQTNHLELSSAVGTSMPTSDHSKTDTVSSTETETAPALRTITIPMIPPSTNTKFCSKIWSDIVIVQDMGDEVAQYLSSIVQYDKDLPDEIKQAGVRLVVQCPEDIRSADDRYVPGSARTLISGTGPNVSLSDGYPILVASEESLQDLNTRLRKKGKKELPMSRFRPNIVLRGLGEPFAEDRIKVLRITASADGTSKPTILHIIKGCPRCKQSCTDQDTGEVTDEPLDTLREYRTNPNIPGTNGDDLYFAQNAIVGIGSIGNTISVGDHVEVVQWGTPVWDD